MQSTTIKPASAVRKRTSQTLEHNDLELELTHDPDSEVLIMENEEKIVVGYLVQDPDSSHCNPLDNDGAGKIFSFSHHHTNHIDPNTLEFGNPYIIPLSYFEHGNCIWGVAGTMSNMPDFRWDGVKFAGVWKPDRECGIHINTKVAEQFGLKVVTLETACVSADPAHQRDWKLAVMFGDKQLMVTSSWEKASDYAFLLAKKVTDKAEFRKAIIFHAADCAKSACKEYTSWCNGDVWGVCVDTFDLEGNQTEDDACWGYIGSEYAEKEMKDQVEGALK